MRIVIIGAGVAGCIMARHLARLDGVEVRCLERVARDDHSESGTGLNIGPNAVKALAAIDPELSARIGAASFVWDNWRVSLTDGTVLFDLPLRRVADRGGWRIRWSELYRVLREGAEGLVDYNCNIQEIACDPGAPGKSMVSWTDGSAENSLAGIDLLIAGDGRYSAVRSAFSGEPDVQHIGVCIFRLLVPDSSGGLIDDYEQWFNGPNRLLSFRVPPAHIYIAGTFPIAPDRTIPAGWKTAGALRTAYMPPDKLPSAQSRWMIDTICDNISETHWARMQEHDARYCADNSDVLYLGDAAHGMVPTLGQGATQAIEDAAAAVSLIARRWKAGQTNVRDWLSEFAAARGPRTRFVMEFSRDATDTMLDGADPVAGTRHKTEAPFINRLKLLYHDIGIPTDALST